MRTAKLSIVVALFAALTVSGCASSQSVHIATAADTALVAALHQLKADEARAYQTGLYPQARHIEYLKVIVQADHSALALTDSIDAWRAAGGTPATVPAIATEFKAGLQQVLADLSSLPATNGFVVSLKAVIGLLS